MTIAPLSFTSADPACNTEPAIAARNLVKTYKGKSATDPKQALQIIDLAVPKGCVSVCWVQTVPANLPSSIF